MADWTGNKNTVYVTLGASNHSETEREVNDFYATDPLAIDQLLSKETPCHDIWECACGKGHLSKRLEEFGFNVKSTDLIYRGFGEGGWTSSVFMSLFRVIYLQTRLISMRSSLLNTDLNLFRKGIVYGCF